MRRGGFGVGSRSWLVAALCAAQLACGGRSSEHRADADADAGQAGSLAAAGNGSGGNGSGGIGSSSSAGYGGSSITLLGGTAGSLLSIGGADLNGSAGAPAADPGLIDLCLEPEQIPSAWSAGADADAGASSSEACPVGQLGDFWLGPCVYHLLDTTPFDVDPFVGGHARCCYHSALTGCLR